MQNSKFYSLTLLAFFTLNIFSAVDTTSSIKGNTGVGGVSVTIEFEPTGIKTEVLSTDSGSFNVSNLRVGGPYKITATKSGYSSDSIDDVYIVLGQPTVVNLYLGSADSLEEVVVVGSKTSSLDFGSSLSISETDIDNQPSIERAISEYLARDSRITVEGTARNASISVAGANNRYNNFQIDGVESGDPFGLNANGFGSIRNPISIETVSQINVDITPYDVSKGAFTGANINAVTKSGTNEFHGSYSVYEIDEDDVGKLNGRKVSQFKDKTEVYTFGGPIIKDKAFFFLAYEEYESATPADAQRYTIPSDALLSEVAAYAKNVLNYDAGSLDYLPPPEMAEKQLAKLEYNFDNGDRFEYVYSYSNDNAVNPYLNRTGNAAFSSTVYNIPTEIEKETFAYYGNLGSNFSYQIKYTENDFSNDQDPLGGEDFGQIRIMVTDPSGGYESGKKIENIYFGGDQYRHANELAAFDKITNLKGVYVTGDHEISFGYDLVEKSVLNLFVARENGEWEFKGVEAFYAGTPSKLRFKKPVAGLELADVAAAFSAEFTTLYLQDKWYYSDVLTLNMGVRYDVVELLDKPAANASFLGFAGFSNSDIPKQSVLQPRFGFNLDITDSLYDGKVASAELRGGFGWFAGRVPNVWLANPFSNTGVITWEVNESNPSKVTDYTSYYSGLNLADIYDQADYLKSGAAEGVSPGYQNPLDFKTSLELSVTTLNDFRYSLSYIKSTVEEAISITDPSLTCDAPNRTGTQKCTNKGYYVLDNVSQGGSETWTISLSKSWDNLEAFWSYSNVEATDVWDGQSSQASSNWQYSTRADAATAVEARSDWSRETRITAGLNYTAQFIPNAPTRFSLFYKGYSGDPFSYVYGQLNMGGSLNADDVLVYVPTGVNDPNVVFSSAAVAAQVMDAISSAGLDGYKGRIAPRNIGTTPKERRVDLRISQEIPLISDHKLFIYFDVLNLLNLIDSDKGKDYYYGFDTAELINTSGFDSSGRLKITGVANDKPTLSDSNSRYRMQLGFVYKF